MTQGRFIAVVGPSGVGKDSLMDAVVAMRPGLRRVRRVITRPADQGGEPFEPVSVAEFRTRVAQSTFCLHWEAHGLHYGIPDAVKGAVKDGEDVLANLSRGSLGDAMEVFPHVVGVFVRADPAIVAERLRGRGRESRSDITLRLSRKVPARPEGLTAIEIDNSGPIEQSAARLLDALYPERL